MELRWRSAFLRALGRAGVLGLGLGLAGCAGPQFVPHPQSGIELRWPNGQDSFDEARAKADERCGTEAQHAALTFLAIDRDETLARFACARS